MSALFQPDIHDELNPGQRAAVECLEGPVMVLAGAGAGKTKTVIHRTANLIHHGIPPTHILVVTFTNKAAAELKNRLEVMAGESAQFITTGTFHSICFRKILKRYADPGFLSSMGLQDRFVILDDDDAGKNLKLAVKSLSPQEKEQITTNNWNLREFEGIMGSARAGGMDLQGFRRYVNSLSGDPEEELYKVAASVWEHYERLCREANGMDFDDILVLSLKLLEYNPRVSELLAQEYQYLMLDEYQDTNTVQMMIMDAIAAHHRNICVVGDERQSIYRFRGANIDVILNFEARYPETRKIVLDINYRSTASILGAANSLADAMRQRLTESQLRAGSGYRDAVPRLVAFQTDTQEANWIVSEMAERMRAGENLQNIAVLYRSRALRTQVERALLEHNIPYAIVGDTGFFQKKEIRDVVALLRFTLHPKDTMAGLRVLDAVKVGVTSNAARKALTERGVNVHQFLDEIAQKYLAEVARKLKMDLTAFKAQVEAEGIDALVKDIPCEELPTRGRKVHALLDLMDIICESIDYNDEPAMIREGFKSLWEIFMKESLEKYSKQTTSSDADDDAMIRRIENVEYLLERFARCLEEGQDVEEVIEDLTLMVEDSASAKDAEGKVKLMTIHAAKGLEFKSVYLVGMEDQVSPGNTEDPQEMEEERRIVYVAMTRAEHNLTVSYARQRMIYGSLSRTTRSRFLDEVEGHMEEVNPNLKRVRTAAKGRTDGGKSFGYGR